MKSRAYVRRRSADTNLAEIHEEMSELLDKQVNVQKDGLKISSGVHESYRKPTKKCAMKMKEEKNNCCIKIFVLTGKTL